jgi:hypothetical protein
MHNLKTYRSRLDIEVCSYDNFSWSVSYDGSRVKLTEAKREINPTRNKDTAEMTM